VHRLLAGLWLLIGFAGKLGAQGGSLDSTEVVLEHSFADQSDSAVVVLRRRVAYRAELSGSDSLVITSLDAHRWPPLIVPTGFASEGARSYEVHPTTSGAYSVRVVGIRDASGAVLRIYGDRVETKRLAVGRERSWNIGLGLAAGLHSGYRLDPTGGADPSGGGDIEGYLLMEGGFPVSVYLGIARQSFPDAEFVETWYFVEPRLRLLSQTLLGTTRTDLGVMLRIAQGGEVGNREISPSQLGVGVFVNQHLAVEGRRRGWSVFGAYQHARLGNVPETEKRDTDRVFVGLTWIP
jgi:hypothetical protein